MNKFSKKHYEVLATAFSNSKPLEHDTRNQGNGLQWQWERTLESIITELKKDNPAFNPEKFKKWAGG